MNRPVKLLVASLLVCLTAISAGSVAATNRYQNEDLDQVQLREELEEQLNDGGYTEPEPLQERIQDRTQEQLQEQLREQLRYGSCAETGAVEEPVQETTQERSRLREQFRYGCTE